MTSCRDFREHLELALSSGSSKLSELSWHRHLTTCSACRELLEAEEVLELLLDTLPAPSLPPALAERVLLRLRSDRNDEALERLLALDDHVSAPVDLSDQVLAGLSATRDVHDPNNDPLDRLLSKLPEPVPPRDLAARVLEGLDAERREPVLWARRLERLLAAALVIAGLGTAFWILRTPEELNPVDGVDVVRADPAVLEPSEAPTEILENLDILENYDLLRSDELLVQLGTEVHDLSTDWTDGGRR